MPDSNIVAKIRDHDGTVMKIIQPFNDSSSGKPVNTSLNTYPTSGFMYEPSIVDTDIDSNIWVAFTQPLSSFIRKYDLNGVDLGSSYEFEFPQYVVPQDMVVDYDGNVWVATSNVQRVPETAITTNITAWKHTDGSSVVYAFPTGTNLLSAVAGYSIVESEWDVSNKHFGGRLLVNDFDATPSAADQVWLLGNYPYFTVKPYTGRVDTISTTHTTLSTTINFYPSDRIYKFGSDGTKLFELSGFFKPTYMTIDKLQNCWVCHDVNTVTQISPQGAILKQIRVETEDFISLSASNFDVSTYNVQQLGGISCDPLEAVVTINSYENKIFKNTTSDISISAYTTIDSTNDLAVSGSNMYRAYGDWTSWRWVNKYARSGGGTDMVLSGQTTFNILPSGGQYKVGIINEDFDPAETIKSYRFQPQLLEHEELFDNFYGQIVGTSNSEPTTLGKSTYEKIANFAARHSDVDECSINALYSLCAQYNVPITNFNLNFIGGLKRIMDITSIPHKKLWGARSTFDRDFEKIGTATNYATDIIRGVNIGNEITSVTATGGVTYT
jgi:hypothetical protein